MEIRDKPCVVLKRRCVEWRSVAKPSYRKRNGKHRSRVDHTLGMNATQMAAIQRNDVDAFVSRHDRDDDLTRSDIVLHTVVEMVDELAVTLGYRNERLRLRPALFDPRAKVKQPGP